MTGSLVATEAPSNTLVTLADLKKIELIVLKRMRDYAAGTHPSVFQGFGSNFVGLRDWQPGDRPSDIDWAQSTLTNFSPLVSREFEQDSSASMVIIADTSLSTRFGADNTSIAKVVARSVATLGLAGAFLQDRVGLVTLNQRNRRLAVRPRAGKNHAIHCIETYQKEVFATDHNQADAPSSLIGLLRHQSLVPVISDFLFSDASNVIEELGQLGTVHDVFLVLIDCTFVYRLPSLSAGWVETYDVETQQTRLLSARELDRLAQEVGEWQEEVIGLATAAGLEVVLVKPGNEHEALANFLAQRRLRRR
jgi:uncharacterized protein (DUF58 family)